MVEAWESAADPAREAGARVVHFRQAPILARHEGMIKRMLLPFRLGLGGRVGSGDQWWSWVALDDVVAAYLFALDRPLAGTFNLVAPGVVRRSRVRRRARRRPPSADRAPLAGDRGPRRLG